MVAVLAVQVDIAVGPPPVGRPEVVEPANGRHLPRPLITHPYRLYPVADQVADKVCATMGTNYPGGKRSDDSFVNLRASLGRAPSAA